MDELHRAFYLKPKRRLIYSPGERGYYWELLAGYTRLVSEKTYKSKQEAKWEYENKLIRWI